MKRGFLKKCDLFSQQFSFLVGNDKKKSTTYGGLFSVIIYLFSLMFLVYLLTLYFNNKFLPKIGSQTFNEQKNQSLTFGDSLFAFQVIAKGRLLSDYELETNQKYLQFQVRLTEYKQDSTTIITFIPIKQCELGTLFEGYQCLDLSGQPEENKTLHIDPSNYVSSNYELVVSQCKGLPDCASPQEINDVIVNKQTSIFVKTLVEEYDSSSKKLQQITKLDYFNFDEQLSIISTFKMQRQVTKVESGAFIQSLEQLEHQVGYQKIERYFTQTNMQNKLGYEGYACISFELDQTYVVMTVQFPMITEVLSQFMSIFNILLAFGIFAQRLGRSKIVDEIQSIFLKEYYKKTSLNLIENNKKQPYQIKGSKKTAADIFKLQEQINGSDIVKLQKESFKIRLISRIKTGILRIFKKIPKFVSDEQIIYKQIKKNTAKSIDIYEVVRDLIKLKIAIKLILSKDQYAALQYCGSEFQIKDKVQNMKAVQIIEIQKDKQAKLEDITKSNNKEEDILHNNLDKKQSTQNDELDQVKNSIKLNTKESSNFQLSTQKQSEQQLQQQQQQNQSLQLEQQQNQQFKSQQLEQLDQLQQIQQLQTQVNLSCLNDTLYGKKKIPLIEIKSQEEFFDQYLPLISQRISPISFNNHLQEIDEIVNNKEQMQTQLGLFISRVENQGQYLSQIDQNIYSSLICKTQNQDNLNICIVKNKI